MSQPSQPYARVPVSSPKPRRKRRRTTLLPDSDDDGDEALGPQRAQSGAEEAPPLPGRAAGGEEEAGAEEGEGDCVVQDADDDVPEDLCSDESDAEERGASRATVEVIDLAGDTDEGDVDEEGDGDAGETVDGDSDDEIEIVLEDTEDEESSTNNGHDDIVVCDSRGRAPQPAITSSSSSSSSSSSAGGAVDAMLDGFSPDPHLPFYLPTRSIGPSAPLAAHVSVDYAGQFGGACAPVARVALPVSAWPGCPPIYRVTGKKGGGGSAAELRKGDIARNRAFAAQRRARSKKKPVRRAKGAGAGASGDAPGHAAPRPPVPLAQILRPVPVAKIGVMPKPFPASDWLK
jgi:hypothetical protein